MNKRLATCLALLIAAPFLVSAPIAWGAGTEAPYPTRPISVIVPWAPGGAAELPIRVVTEFLAKEWGHPINIENKPGGNTLTGSFALMRSAADGYTLMADSPGSSSLQAGLPEKLPFNIEDRTFVAQVSTSPMVYYAKAGSPWNSLKDVAEAAKSNPAKFSAGRLGAGSLVDLCMMQFLTDARVDVSKIKLVAFKGSSEVATAIAGGHIQFACSGPGTIISFVASKTVKPLGVTGTNRVEVWPDTPTAIEQGFSSVRATLWNGISGPKGLPATVTDKWAKGIEKALKDPGVVAKIKKLGSTAQFVGPDPFRQAVLEEIRQAKKFFGGSK